MKSEKFALDTLELVNEMKVCFQARGENEAFARIAVAAFASQLDPTIEEIAERYYQFVKNEMFEKCE